MRAIEECLISRPSERRKSGVSVINAPVVFRLAARSICLNVSVAYYNVYLHNQAFALRGRLVYVIDA